MKMKIPLTGTVREAKPYVSGEPDDPIRMVNIDLGNVSWTLITLDLDDKTMEIEVTPSEKTEYDTGEVDEQGQPIWASRPTTPKERTRLIDNARNHSLARMSKQALYARSKSPRLINPFKVDSVPEVTT